MRIVLGLLTILIIGGEAASMPVGNTASLPRQHIVEIRAFSFTPQRILASPGDTIVWINRDIVPHTVTAGGGTWTSHTLKEGQSWEVVLENSGVYAYFCEFHPHMTGVLATSRQEGSGQKN